MRIYLYLYISIYIIEIFTHLTHLYLDVSGLLFLYLHFIFIFLLIVLSIHPPIPIYSNLFLSMLRRSVEKYKYQSWNFHGWIATHHQSLRVYSISPLKNLLFILYLSAHPSIIYLYVNIYIYMCVCVCVCFLGWRFPIFLPALAGGYAASQRRLPRDGGLPSWRPARWRGSVSEGWGSASKFILPWVFFKHGDSCFLYIIKITFDIPTPKNMFGDREPAMYTYTCPCFTRTGHGYLQDGEDDDVTPTAQANLRASQRVSNKGRKGRPRKNADGDAPKPKSKARSKTHKESKGCPKAKSRGRPPKAEKSELKPRVRGGKKRDKSGDDVKNGSAGSCPDPITPSEPAPKRRARTKSVARSPPQSESADGRTFGCGRCRGTKTGCKTCRNPDYKPRAKRS